MTTRRTGRLDWSPAGALVGVVGGLLWIPVQLVHPPEPQVLFSVLLGCGLAVIGAASFGATVVWFCARSAMSSATVRRLVMGLAVAVVIAGGPGVAIGFVAGRGDVVVRVGLVRPLWVLLVGSLLIVVVIRHCAGRAANVAGPGGR